MVVRDRLTPDDFVIKGQLGPRALRVLIRVQELVSARGAYSYVEIGSYLGRSLQSHLQDEDCARALSIDLRPDVTPDERGALGMYSGITADDMIEGLRRICSEGDLTKLEAATATSDILRGRDERFDLALIDGEHTNTAAFRDFLNVLGVMEPEGVICFDDTTLVYAGISNALAVLEERGIQHAYAFCKGGITVIALGPDAGAFIGGLDEGMILPEGRVARQTRHRMIEAALSEVAPRHLAGNAEAEARLIDTLNRLGYRIERVPEPAE